MSLYERTYGTDWDSLDRDAVIARAFAIGVDEAMGADHAEERERLADEISSAYDQSVVELAYDEGRKEALDLNPATTDEQSIWQDLVDDAADDPVEVPPDPSETGRTSLPAALSSIDALERRVDDSRESLRKPDFLEE